MQDKILLIELAGIGDAVLSTPAIRNLRHFFPDAYIGYLTLPGPAELIRKSPYLDEIYTLHQGLNFFRNFSVLKRLRRLHIDILINLYQLYTKNGIFKMALLSNFLKAKTKIGRDTDGKSFFYDIKVTDYLNSERHDVEYKLDLLKAMGCKVKDKQLELWLDDSDIQAAREFLENNSITNSDILIGIHPGAHRFSRRWDWINFATLADGLAQKYKAKIVITGGNTDRGLAKKIRQKLSSQSIDTTGRFSLTQLSALIKRFNLYITNDTGLMHIANALKVPLVAIMGPGIMKTGPYQGENCIVIRKDAECSPCYKFRCKDLRCLRSITVEEVIGVADKLIQRR